MIYPPCVTLLNVMAAALSIIAYYLVKATDLQLPLIISLDLIGLQVVGPSAGL